MLNFETHRRKVALQNVLLGELVSPQAPFSCALGENTGARGALKHSHPWLVISASAREDQISTKVPSRRTFIFRPRHSTVLPRNESNQMAA